MPPPVSVIDTLTVALSVMVTVAGAETEPTAAPPTLVDSAGDPRSPGRTRIVSSKELPSLPDVGVKRSVAVRAPAPENSSFGRGVAAPATVTPVPVAVSAANGRPEPARGVPVGEASTSGTATTSPAASARPRLTVTSACSEVAPSPMSPPPVTVTAVGSSSRIRPVKVVVPRVTCAGRLGALSVTVNVVSGPSTSPNPFADSPAEPSSVPIVCSVQPLWSRLGSV